MAKYIIDNRPGSIDFRTQPDMVRRTIQNARNLMMTRKGEIPYDRLRGLNPAIFDLPLPRMQDALTPELDRVFLWEPDTELVKARCYLDARGQLIIEAEIEIGIEE